MKVDFLIVGAGPVGLAMANALLSLNKSIAIVDRGAPESEWSDDFALRVSSINQSSADLLQQLGCWQSIIDDRAQAFEAMMIWDQNSDGRICFDAADIGEQQLGHIIENRVISRALHHNLATAEQVHHFYSQTPIALTHSENLWHLELASNQSIDAKLLIGADGSRSWVREQVDIKTEHLSYGQSALVCVIKTEKPHQNTAYQRFLATGPLAFLPLSDPHYCSIVWSTTTEQAKSLAHLDADQFNQTLAEAFDYCLGTTTVIGARANFPLYQHHAQSYINDQLALIGDAAHSIHPLAGQGLNLGLADAKALLEAISWNHDKKRPSGSSAMLKRYHRQRRSHNAIAQHAMSAINTLFSNQSQALAHLRGWGMNLNNRCQPLKNWQSQFASGEPFMNQQLATTEKMQNLIQNILAQAKKRGATSAEVGLSCGVGLSTTVRMGKVETLEHNQDQGFGITVYYGKRRGSASTTDLDESALEYTLSAACDIAKYTQEDDCSGLADPDKMAKDWPELDLFHPWQLDSAAAIELAKECEAIGRAYDKSIINSDGASVSTSTSSRTYANSHGFIHTNHSSYHSISCCLIAEQENKMQRDYFYSVARNRNDLLDVNAIGTMAAKRTVSRLGARKIKTCQSPVIFEKDIAKGLIGSFLKAISGGNLHRKSSLLIDSLGQKIFPDFIQIKEDPFTAKGMGSCPYDSEGVAVSARDIVKDGVVQGYLLNSYSARKLGMETTGNGGGAHNIFVPGKDLDFKALLKKMNTGFVATELIGQGVNLITGDYSRGASGFWVENGEIQYPVEEIIIAGNLRQMWSDIVTIGNDIDPNSAVHCGSILIENMMVAGA